MMAMRMMIEIPFTSLWNGASCETYDDDDDDDDDRNSLHNRCEMISDSL